MGKDRRLNINIGNAANLFFSNSSLESVYFEAVANSIDANATKIWINITIGDFTDVSSFELEISDNGDGFNEKNFYKFSNLLEVDEKTHRGVGRLVFLQYFDKIVINSSYGNKIRNFTFNNIFYGNSSFSTGKKVNKTTLLFSDYNKAKIKEYKYLIPENIKQSLLQYFFPKFYKFKCDKRPLEIIISLSTNKPNKNYNFFSSSSTLNVFTIPELIEEDCDEQSIDLFANFKLLYSVKQIFENTTLITAICTDGRTIAEDIISKNTLPYGYEMIFLLFSDYFSGKTNVSRDVLELDEDSTKKIKKMFSNKISEILNKLIPEIQEQNTKLGNELNEKYPHLQGYFEKDTIGLIERDNTIEIAQKKFLKDQKDILEATTLDDIRYEKYLEVSSRLLAEYVLYRNLIINKLKKIDKNKDEEEIHNLIVPKNKTFQNDNFMETIFTNNAWLLDDKYMSYTTILSDIKIREIYNTIGIHEENKNENKRPDITIIFSNNPDKTTKVDAVIVELKKLGLNLERKEYLISQLRQKARILLSHYPDKIQRIWFYGIVDIDPDLKISLLEDDYIELFSIGSLFYKEQTIIINDDPNNKIPWGLFIQSYESFVSDAETRNSTFLKILKEGIKRTNKNLSKENNDIIKSEHHNTEQDIDKQEPSHA